MAWAFNVPSTKTPKQDVKKQERAKAKTHDKIEDHLIELGKMYKQNRNPTEPEREPERQVRHTKGGWFLW